MDFHSWRDYNLIFQRCSNKEKFVSCSYNTRLVSYHRFINLGFFKLPARLTSKSVLVPQINWITDIHISRKPRDLARTSQNWWSARRGVPNLSDPLLLGRRKTINVCRSCQHWSVVTRQKLRVSRLRPDRGVRFNPGSEPLRIINKQTFESIFTCLFWYF